MSAEVLRRAAALMRERAERVEVADGDGLTMSWAEACNEYIPGADGEHIASWHPAVALAVADLLEGVAADQPWDFRHEEALAVARAYLGGEQ